MLGRPYRVVTCFQHMLHCRKCSLRWSWMIFDVLCRLLLVPPGQYRVVGLWFLQRMYEPGLSLEKIPGLSSQT